MERDGPSGALATPALVAFALAYLAAFYLGVRLNLAAGEVGLFWPANGVLLGVLLRLRSRRERVAAIAADDAEQSSPTVRKLVLRKRIVILLPFQ